MSPTFEGPDPETEQRAPAAPEENPAPDDPRGRGPQDGGLRHLGLMMLLAGGLFTCINGVIMMAALAALMAGGQRGAGLAMLLAVAALVRSALHASAGASLIALSANGSRQASTYGVVGILHGLIVLVVSHTMGEAPRPGIAQSVGQVLPLLAWPIAVLILLRRPSVRWVLDQLASGEDAPSTPDHGIQGAGVLMTLLAAIGLIFGSLVLWFMWKFKLQSLGVTGILWLLLGLALVARSAVHLFTGIQSLGPGGSVGFAPRISRYQMVAVLSAVLMILAGGLTVLQSPSPLPILLVLLVAAMLMIWPIGIRLFNARVTVEEILEDSPGLGEDEPSPAQARDGGLSAIGYLLVAMGATSLAQILGTLLASGQLTPDTLDQLLKSLGGALLLRLGSVPGGVATPLLLAAVTLWAGIELLSMSSRYRVAAIVYGVLAITHAVWLYSPLLKAFSEFAPAGGPKTMEFLLLPLAIATPAAALVLPLLTLVLANRRLPAPP